MKYRKHILLAAFLCMVVGCSVSDKRSLEFDEKINLSGHIQCSVSFCDVDCQGDKYS